MMLFMHMLVGGHEVSFTHLKENKVEKKKVNNSPKSKQNGQEHHQISALQRNRLTEPHGISTAITAPSRKVLLQIVHIIDTK